jgi:hypothetical protein
MLATQSPLQGLVDVDVKPHMSTTPSNPQDCRVSTTGYDIIEDMYSPRTAAMNLILELASFKGKESLQKFITFLVGIFTRYNETPVEQRSYTQKDGALLAIGSLADRLKQTSPYKDALEDMLVCGRSVPRRWCRRPLRSLRVAHLQLSSLRGMSVSRQSSCQKARGGGSYASPRQRLAQGWPGPRRTGSSEVEGATGCGRTACHLSMHSTIIRPGSAPVELALLFLLWCPNPSGQSRESALWSRSILLRYLTETLLADDLHMSETKGLG